MPESVVVNRPPAQPLVQVIGGDAAASEPLIDHQPAFVGALEQLLKDHLHRAPAVTRNPNVSQDPLRFFFDDLAVPLRPVHQPQGVLSR